MNKITQEDLPKYRRLMLLDMQSAVPKPLTESERNERVDLTIEFNSKYPNWRDGAVNFVTGEIQTREQMEGGKVID